MVYFRKRFALEDMVWIQELIARSTKEKTGRDTDKGPPSKSGKLIVDATVVPADIEYPTDVISVSVVQRFCFVDRLSWDNYNESGDLKAR